MRVDIERVKELGSFFELIRHNQISLRTEVGVMDEMVAAKLAEAIANWLEKYRFPAYRFEMRRAAPALSSSRDQLNSTIVMPSSYGQPPRKSLDALCTSTFPYESITYVLADGVAEVTFAPDIYRHHCSSKLLIFYRKSVICRSGGHKAIN